MKRGVVPWIAAAALLLVVVAAAFLLPVREWAGGFEDRVEGMDKAAGLVAFGAAYVAATLLLVPGWIFPVAAGALFGVGWGLVAALPSTIASSAAAFVIARYLLRGPAEKLARRHRLFDAFDRAVGKEGWRIVALARLSPLLSFGMKNYFFGLTGVRFVPYLAGTLLGMMPGLLLKVWLGAAGRDVAGGGGPLQWALLAAGIAATIAASVIVTRLTRARLKLSARG